MPRQGGPKSEALAGIRIGISGGRPEAGRTTRTDAAGHFAFLDLPAGNYTTWADTTEWYVPASGAEVTGENDPEVWTPGTWPDRA
ncbi:carboxypeptidase-like regulatory domain-containing protein [Amycolatopsis sp. NPDC049688]|uniref:carboxypeptidase-like regulatory domain-containing protein n=1 Tax=Amycolatopsis sp. NPDC049688 TaxID=3154733 RepID=UPI00341C4D35